ncbi:MAG: DUF2726 domain-containing protein [Rhodospirillales bacterium]|nr:DUF2726 domain-containing protein [Rhodospirillales bacterium]
MEFVIVGLAVFGLYSIYSLIQRIKRKAKWKKNFIGDVNNQKRFVSQGKFYKKKLMNKSEFRVFQVLEQWIKSNANLGFRLFSQVAIGEYLGASENQAFHSINSKRVDFLIINPFGEAMVAIEYQGEAHYQNNAQDRDEVKAIAHDKAGIKLVEIFPDEDETGISNKINSALGLSSA